MKFKVGDRVKIREWDDMVKEFGVNSIGSINVSGHFTEGMRHLCGREATILSIGECKKIALKDWSDSSGDTVWTYSTDMIEPVHAAKSKYPTIIITTDGTTTTAMMRNGKETVKSESVKLYHKDTFDHATGARLALDRLFGIELVKQDKAAEAEPVKLYCVKSNATGNLLTKGKTHTFVPGRPFPYDCAAGQPYASFKVWSSLFPGLATCLVHLVKRPAKVGEWVYAIVDCPFKRYKKGDILRVNKAPIESDVKGKGVRYDHKKCDLFIIWDNEYLVLDGYSPEPEKPEVREVKRHAKPGEWIKLIRSTYSFDEAGDILKVDCVGDGYIEIYGRNHKRGTGDPEYPWGYVHSNYVVLEGYTPPND